MTGSFCVFEYRYRDAANHKQHEAVVLLGSVKSDDVDVILKSINDDCWFIPEVVGLPSLQERFLKFGRVPDCDDHVWHEFVNLRVADGDDLYRLKATGFKDELIAAFRGVMVWDESKSPIFKTLYGGRAGAFRKINQ